MYYSDRTQLTTEDNMIKTLLRSYVYVVWMSTMCVFCFFTFNQFSPLISNKSNQLEGGWQPVTWWHSPSYYERPKMKVNCSMLWSLVKFLWLLCHPCSPRYLDKAHLKQGISSSHLASRCIIDLLRCFLTVNIYITSLAAYIRFTSCTKSSKGV